MKFSLDWLRQYVELPEEPSRVAGLLAEAGLPVDAIEAWGADHQMDVDVMANRPDCMAHLGVARELGARLGRPLRRPTSEPPRGPTAATDLAAVEVLAPDLCPRYTALVMTGVRIGESPDWLVDRLASIGLRPVNNVVDITNFVLHETGQPLHAFDLDRLAGQRIVVRRPREGERLHTLDGVERVLEPEQLVIADGDRPVALAGIMGGADSEIGHETGRVLLESAHFDPRVTRSTARRFQMHTDASHRFERGTDPGATLEAALRAADLILELAGGELCAGEIDQGVEGIERRDLTVSHGQIARLLGLEIEPQRAAASLSSLGFEVSPLEWSGGEALIRVQVPTWRGDVRRPEDLVEEVARMVGYDRIPFTLPSFNTDQTGAPSPSAGRDRLRRYLVASGLHEALTFPMHDRDAQDVFKEVHLAGGCYVELENPLTRSMGTLRISLLPGLLEAVVHNRNRGVDDVRLFEIGRTFLDPTPVDPAAVRLPEERHLLAVALTGQRSASHFQGPAAALNYFDLKGLLEGLTSTVLGVSCRVRTAGARLSFLAPGLQGEIELDGQVRGFIGRLEPDTAERLDLPAETYVLEIDVSGVGTTPPQIDFRPPPRYPCVERDLALILAADLPYQRVADVIRDAGGGWLESVSPFDRYAGKGIPSDKYSLAVRLSFRHPERTLTADEVQDIQDGIVARLVDDLGARLRDAAGAAG